MQILTLDLGLGDGDLEIDNLGNTNDKFDDTEPDLKEDFDKLEYSKYFSVCTYIYINLFLIKPPKSNTHKPESQNFLDPVLAKP